MIEEKICFKGKIVRSTYDSENFKVYAVDVDKTKYPNVKLNKYENVTISGNIHSLGIGQPYDITGIEEKTKYGYGYKIVNIKRDRPMNEYDMQIFLQEILTSNQASILYQSYPNIVDKVINNDLSDIDLNKTKGIKEITFNKIKEKIIENFALVDLVNEFQGLLSLPMLKKLYINYPSLQKIKYELQHNPYKCLCGLSGVGFKTADSLLIQIDETSKENIKNNKEAIIDFRFNLKTSQQRCKSCLIFLLEENENCGNTKMNLIELKNQCDNLTPECSYNFVDCLKNEEFYYNKEKIEVSLKRTFNIESYIATTLLNGLSNNKVWDIDYKKYQNIDNISLTDEQIKALQMVCFNNVNCLIGYAGSGKSATTSAVISMLKDNNKTFKLFAPTGRASKVLAEYTNQPTYTIHRGLGYMPPNIWNYNEKNKLDVDIVIIDEFSMCDIFLFEKLLNAIDLSKTKILLIGDPEQIPSVSAGNILYDIIKSKVIPTTTLTRIFRYGKGGLMTVATDVRNSKKYISDDNKNEQILFFGENKDYVFINASSENTLKSTLSLYKKLISQNKKPKDILVLTSYNKGDLGTVKINGFLQKIANPRSLDNKSPYIKIGETEYYKGDIVIQKNNNYKARVYIENCEYYNEDDIPTAFIANGEIGEVIDIKYNSIVIKFDDVSVEYDKSDMLSIGLGYSISIHKCITEDTYLYTTKGIKQLKDLNNGAEKNCQKEIKDDIKIFNGKYFEKPSYFYNNGYVDCRNIKTKRGYEITCSYGHGIDIIDNDGYIIRKNSEFLTTNDYVLIRKNMQCFGNNINIPKEWLNIQNNNHETIYKLPILIDENFSKFLGYMVADGTVCHGGIKFGKRHKEVVEDFISVCQNLFGIKKPQIQYKVSNNKNNGMYLVEINSTFIRKFCEKIDGIQPNNKFVPNCILETNKKNQISFLQSVFEDGTVNVKKDVFDHIEFCAKNKNFIKQISIMLLNFGIITTTSTSMKIEGNSKYLIYKLYIYKMDAKIFYNEIKFVSNFKNSRLKLLEKCEDTNSNILFPNIINIIKNLIIEFNLNYKIFDKNFIYSKQTNISKSTLFKFIHLFENNELLNKDKRFVYLKDLYYNYHIEKIKEINECKEHTYCLEMPETHKFIQNGFSAWNSQGGSCDTIILLTPKQHTFMLNANLMYVGLTRTKKQCYHIGSVDVINNSLKKKENLSRITFLCNLLKHPI